MDYCSSVNQGVETANSELLASCFTTDPSKHIGGVDMIQKLIQANDVDLLVSSIQNSTLRKAAAAHILMMKYNASINLERSAYYQNEFFDFFSQFISSAPIPALAPLAIRICKESQQFVEQIAKQTSIIESRELSDFIKGIRNLLIVCSNAEFAHSSSHNALISILNSYLKNLFCQRNFIAAQVLLDPYQDILEKELSACPISELTTFYYYYGRLFIYTEQYDSAMEYLSKAIQICDPANERNLSRLLFFYIPLMMKSGRLPKDDLLQRFGFTMYSIMVLCCRTGNITLFEQVLSENSLTINKRGLHLLFSKIKAMIYARLILRIRETYNEFHVPYSALRSGFQYYGREVTDEEITCIINSLVLLGHLKCYASFNHKTVVFSKKLFSVC